jgi:hypothetical protein
VVESEALSAVIMKSPVFWDMTPCSRMVSTRYHHETGTKILAAVFVFVSSSAYFGNLRMEAVSCTEASVGFYETAWSCIPEDATLRNANVFHSLPIIVITSAMIVQHSEHTMRSCLSHRPYIQIREPLDEFSRNFV